MKVYRGIKNLSEPAIFESWLHRITVNTCLTALENRKRKPVIKIHLDDGEETNGFDGIIDSLKFTRRSNSAFENFFADNFRFVAAFVFDYVEPNYGTGAGRAAI